MTVNPKALARAVAFVAWADEKLQPEELAYIRELFPKYGVDPVEGQKMAEGFIEEILDSGESEEDGPISIGVLDFGDVDARDVLTDLAELAMVDKEADYRELEMIHEIGKAANINPVVVSGALLAAAKKYDAALPFAKGGK